MPRLRFFSLLFLAPALLVGCIGPRPLRPGNASLSAGTNGIVATVRQPENPQQASSQQIERVTETRPDGTVRVTEKAGATIGAAQKDTAREIAAKLASTRPVQIVGVILILAALAMFHPVVRAVTASSTLQMVTGAVGLFLIFAPVVVVGNEKLLLVLGIAGPAAYFFIHRHGKLQGLVDANKNGIDDREEKQ